MLSPASSPEPGVAGQQRGNRRSLHAPLAGFRGHYLLDGGPDALITISMFDSADEALMSNEKAVAWVRNNVMEFARGMPEIMVGDVLVAEVK